MVTLEHAIKEIKKVKELAGSYKSMMRKYHKTVVRRMDEYLEMNKRNEKTLKECLDRITKLEGKNDAL